jgi:hypothetical protein
MENFPLSKPYLTACNKDNAVTFCVREIRVIRYRELATERTRWLHQNWEHVAGVGNEIKMVNQYVIVYCLIYTNLYLFNIKSKTQQTGRLSNA